MIDDRCAFDRQSMSSIELDNGEFLILADESCHMVGQSELQIQFTPSTLYLSNFHIILDPQYDVEILRKIPLSDITKITQAAFNECPVLEILSEDASQSIRVFIPDESHRIAFVSILRHICKANEEGQESCDRFAMTMRRSIQDYDTLSLFYKNYNVDPNVDQAKILAEKELKAQRARKIKEQFAKSLSMFNFVADFLYTCPELFFAVCVFFVSILTLFFEYVSFGGFMSFIGAFVVLYNGLMRVTGWYKKEERLSPEDVQRPLRPFIRSDNQFHKILNNRFNWEIPRSTLEVMLFLVVLSLLFIFYDPVLLCIIAIIGLAFFERWNFFGIGSLSSLISHLILW